VLWPDCADATKSAQHTLDCVQLAAAFARARSALANHLSLSLSSITNTITYHPPPITYHLPPTTHNPSPITYHPSPTTHHLSPTTHHLPPITHHLHLSPIHDKLTIRQRCWCWCGRWKQSPAYQRRPMVPSRKHRLLSRYAEGIPGV